MQHIRESIESTSLNCLLWRYSVPAMLGMLLHALNGIIDRYFVSQHVEQLGLAALSVAFPIFSLLLGITLWLGVGSASILSLKIGENDTEQTKRIVRVGTLLSLIVIPITVAILYLSIDPLVRWSGGKGEVVAETKNYLLPLFIGFIAWSYSTFISGAIRSFGFPKLSLLVVSLSPLFNILLDYVFIAKMEWGLYGAGLATAISYGVSATVGGLLWWKLNPLADSTSTDTTQQPKLNLHFSQTTRTIAKFGLATFLLALSGALFQSLVNQQAEQYGGDAALGVLGLVMTLAGFIFMPVAGLGQGIQPIIGISKGSGDDARSKHLFRLACIYATVILSGCYGLVMLEPNWLLQWFYNDLEELELARNATRITFLLMPFIAFQIIAINFFQATGSPSISTALTVTRQIIILPILLFTLPTAFQLDGVWMVSPVSDGIMALITAATIFYFFKKQRTA